MPNRRLFEPLDFEGLFRCCDLVAERVGLATTDTPLKRNAYGGARAFSNLSHNVIEIGQELITRCVMETDLTRARLEGKQDQTAGQFQMFAAVVRSGDIPKARIDRARPDRKPPLPRSDSRRRMIGALLPH